MAPSAPAPAPARELGITAPMRDFLENITPAREPGSSALDRFRNRSTGSVLENLPSSAGPLFGKSPSVFGRLSKGITALGGLERFGLFRSGTNGIAVGGPPSTQDGGNADNSPASVCADTASFSTNAGWTFENPATGPPEPWYQVR
ncbi:MAG: hypothetical protein SWQ30_21750 [Thermodesulfobacteriota bacterium]|nr:hypothetical protein [Thermodesulfobacteriota bacterium]